MPGMPQRNHLVPLTPFSTQATGITGWQYWKGLPGRHGTSAWWSSLFALRLRKGTATMLNDGQLAPARGYGRGHNNADGLGICSATRAPHPVPVQLPGHDRRAGRHRFHHCPLAGALRHRRGSGPAGGAAAGPCGLPPL